MELGQQPGLDRFELVVKAGFEARFDSLALLFNRRVTHTAKPLPDPRA